MRNFLKFKKSKSVIYLFLIFNQFIISANAFTFRKVNLNNQNTKITRSKNNDEIYISSVNKSINNDQRLIKEAEMLEKFVEETFSPNEFDNFIEQNDQVPMKNLKRESPKNEVINKGEINQPKIEIN